MSAQPMEHEQQVTEAVTPLGPSAAGPEPGGRAEPDRGHDGGGASVETVRAESVEVRRNATVAAVVGVAAAAVAIAYLWRAAGSGAVLDWALCALMGALAVIFLRGLFDARTPLLV